VQLNGLRSEENAWTAKVSSMSVIPMSMPVSVEGFAVVQMVLVLGFVSSASNSRLSMDW